MMHVKPPAQKRIKGQTKERGKYTSEREDD